MFFKWYQGERREQHSGALHLHKCHLLRSSSWCRGQDWQVFSLNVAILILNHFCFIFSLFRIISVFTLLFRLFDIPVGLRSSSSGQFLRRSVLQAESYTVTTIISVVVSIFMTIINTIAITFKSRSPKLMMTITITGRSGEHWPLWVRNSNLGAHALPPGCLDHHLPLPRQGPRLQTPDISDFSDVQGIQSSGKVVYFSATFPYVVLMILLIRFIIIFLQKVLFSRSILKVKKSVGFEKQTKPNDKLYVFFIYQGSHSSWGVPWHQLLFGKIFQDSRTPLSLVFGIWGCVFGILVCVCVLYVGVCIWYLRVVIFSECLCLGSLCLEYTAQYMLWIKFS